MRKLYKKLQRYRCLRFLLVTLVLISTLSISCFAIGDNNSGVLVYNINTKYSNSITSSPSVTSGYNIYQYADTNQVGFIIPSGNNDFSKGYRYCSFSLKNSYSQSYIITIKFVSYYGVQENSVSPFTFSGTSDAWVGSTRYGNGTNFKYSLTDKTGNFTLYGGQFTFELKANSTSSVLLLAGYQDFLAHSIYFNIDIGVSPIQSNQDIIDNQEQNTQDIMDNQNENTDKIVGIFEDNDYNNFDDTQSAVDDYNNAESEVKDTANENLDNVKSDLFDSNLLNPNVNSPIKGFKVISRLVDEISGIPELGLIFKLSISFGIIAFVLGLVITIFKRR